MIAMKHMMHVLVLSIFLIMLANPVLGFSVSYGTNGAYSSIKCNLDRSTALKDVGTLGGGIISRISQVSGSVDNEINYQTSAGGNSINSAIKCSGELSATTSTSASDEIAFLSQDLSGSGDLAAVVQSQSDSTSAGQMNAVLNGQTSALMKAFARKDFSTSEQSTTISGDAGATSSSSRSAENDMAITGEFSGSGDLNTKLTSVAANHAGIYGTNSFNGQEVINNDVLKGIASGELSVSADGIYEDRKGELGDFGVTATNILNPSQNDVYKTAGWAWAVPIHYKLSTSLIGSSTSANANLWAQQISQGANEWDLNTNKDVFKGDDTAITPGTANVLEFTTKNPIVGRYQGGTGDGNNNYMALTKSVRGSTIAVTYTWYYTNQYVAGGFNKAAESDVYFNGNKAWRAATTESKATNSKFDIRTIATHEVGHSLGLLDLYDKTDSEKIMYGYNNGQVKWYLTSADYKGLVNIYGL
jgi:hypothetical protein